MFNKMQSEMAIFRPQCCPPGKLDQPTLHDIRTMPTPGKLDEKYASNLNLAQSLQRVKNMTSSTKPEVDDILHCCHRRTEPQLQVT